MGDHDVVGHFNGVHGCSCFSSSSSPAKAGDPVNAISYLARPYITRIPVFTGLPAFAGNDELGITDELAENATRGVEDIGQLLRQIGECDRRGEQRVERGIIKQS